MRLFCREEIEHLGALAAAGKTYGEIAAATKRPEPTIRWKAARLGLLVKPAPSVRDVSVYNVRLTEQIHILIGHMSAAEIAAKVGVSVASLKSWARDKKIALARPVGATLRAEYNRLRAAAHRLGLRLSAKGGRVSLWVSVIEDLTFKEAAEFLAHANRKARFDAMERAFDIGTVRSNGIATPPIILKAKSPARIQTPRTNVNAPELIAHLHLPTVASPGLERRV